MPSKEKLVNMIEEMYKTIEFYDVEECDPDVADLLNRAEKVIGIHHKPKTNDAMIEAIRQANINPLAP